METGIFLYYPEATYLKETQDALRGLNLNLREIKADSGIVSNLVPGTLRRDAESWLILFPPEKEQELLILPFPDLSLKDLSPPAFRGYLADLMPLLRECLENRSLNISDWIKRFQYLRIDVSVDSALNPDSLPEPGENQENVDFLEKRSQRIQNSRERILSRAHTDEKFSELVVNFDDMFSRETNRLFRDIRNLGFQEVVPQIVHEFWDVMDGETMRFLITSETVREFADNSSFPNFDYSAPSCGLWKAIERELNLSLVLHLRREAGVVKSVSMPWEKSGSKSKKFPILTGVKHIEDLGKLSSKPPKDLEGITLGPMKNMLEWGHCNSVKEKLEKFFSSNDFMLKFSGPLSQYLAEIIQLRNGHAHIRAMSQQDFGTLRNLVLPQPSGNKPITFLVVILQLKKNILGYWEAKGDRFTATRDSIIITENDEIRNLMDYNRVRVKPTEDGKAELFVIGRDRISRISEKIAKFETIEEATDALASLVQTAAGGETWNALTFKNEKKRKGA